MKGHEEMRPGKRGRQKTTWDDGRWKWS